MEKDIPLHVVILCSLFPLSIYSNLIALICLNSCMWKTSLKLKLVLGGRNFFLFKGLHCCLT